MVVALASPNVRPYRLRVKMESPRSFILALLFVGISGFGIVGCHKKNRNLTLDSYGPMVELTGEAESIEEVDGDLHLRLKGDDRLFRTIFGYPDRFYQYKMVLHRLKPGDRIFFHVTESDLEKEPSKVKIWRWLEIYSLRTDATIWLSREGYLQSDRDNRKIGMYFLYGIHGIGLLWLLTTVFPNRMADVWNGISTLFVMIWQAKGWVMVLAMFLCLLEAGSKCWLDQKMKNQPMYEGTIIDRKDVKQYAVLTRHRIDIKPNGSDQVVNSRASWETPERIQFRWDGKAKNIYLREQFGSPWNDLWLVSGFFVFSILVALLHDWYLREHA